MSDCRICGIKTYTEKVTKTMDRYRSTWVECTQCKVERIYPYPTSDELSRYYNDQYLRKKCCGSISHELRFSEKYRPTLYNEYSYSVSDLGLSPEKLCDSSILDFGCANGAFLSWLQSTGAAKEKLFGVDISSEMVEIASRNGFKAFTSDAMQDVPRNFFDFVTLWDVIEHVEYPLQTLLMLREFLRPKGYILLQTPRKGFLSEAFKEEFEHYLPFEHLHLFPREALIFLLEKAGYSIVKTASFGANAPSTRIPGSWKSAYDRLAKMVDEGATQLVLAQNSYVV